MTEIKITKYKAGRAAGAGDLQRRWSSRRLTGLSGTGTKAENKARKNWRKFQRRRKKKARSLVHPVDAESRLIKGPQA